MSMTLTETEARASLYRLIDQAAESHQAIWVAGKRTSAAQIVGALVHLLLR